MAGRLRSRLTQDAYLLCFSAFFADLGYQGVAALFPLYVVFELRQPIYWYGIITGIAFGAGSFFSFVGGLAGDRWDKKCLSIAGNAFIPLMAFSGLSHRLWLSALLFILGWWARYFRTPPRRALLVHVTAPEERGLAFGVLHALDIAGGMLSALAALAMLSFHVPVGTIMLYAAIPLIVSTVLLFFVQRPTLHPGETPMPERMAGRALTATGQRRLLFFLLASATLYGFSFYNLGFPIVTATKGSATTSGYELGVLAFVIYLAISAGSGYLFGVLRLSSLRALWLFGYLPSALGSGLIGLSALFHMDQLAFYLFIAVLGLGMGAVETCEPTLISSLVGATALSQGMGYLSVSRSIGQFLSNIIMGVLFSLSRSAPYFYAFASALAAAVVLAAASAHYTRSGGPAD